MIVRLVAVDPNPDPKRSDLLCYQVPEHSREFKLLAELFTKAGIEWETFEFPRRKKNEASTSSPAS